jgi:peptide/nickel transport system substrate-binding protein
MTKDDKQITGVSRKNFLRGMAAAGAGLMMPNFGPWGAAALAAQEKQAGGILAIGLYLDPPNFDPISNTSGTILATMGPCYNGLVVYNPANQDEIIGDLAESWEFAPDGKALTFNLISGVTFHDGKPMTSADVKASFDVMRDPPAGTSSPRAPALAMIASIDAPDETTVRFNLHQPAPSLLNILAGGWMLVMPKHILGEKGNMKEQVVGTGPFKMASVQAGVSIELVRNPDYHVPERPLLDGIKFYIVPDQGTALSYLTTGQLSLLPSLTGQSKGASIAPEIKVLEGLGSSCYGVTYNTTVAPFDSMDLRKACTLAIDRQAAIQILGNGLGTLAGIALPPWNLPEQELLAIPGYGLDVAANREEARRIMAELGLADGLAVNMLVRRTSHHEAASVFIQDQWAGIGIKVTLEPQDSANFFATVAAGDFQVHASGAGSYSVIDPDAMLAGLVSCGDNTLAYLNCDTEVRDLFLAQSQTLDQEARRKLVNELEVLLLKKYNVSYMYWPSRQMAMSTNVMDMTLHRNIDNNVRMEGVWLAS